MRLSVLYETPRPNAERAYSQHQRDARIVSCPVSERRSSDACAQVLSTTRTFILKTTEGGTAFDCQEGVGARYGRPAVPVAFVRKC